MSAVLIAFLNNSINNKVLGSVMTCDVYRYFTIDLPQTGNASRDKISYQCHLLGNSCNADAVDIVEAVCWSDTVCSADAVDIVEAVCWSNTVCVHVHTRSPGLGITAILGSSF